VVNGKSELSIRSAGGQQNYSQIPNIPGIDTAKGIAMTGGTIAAYTKVLSLFCKDVEERLPILQQTPETNLPAFVTQVHALKSASASIGAQKISSLAAGLEAVGKAGDAAFIRESLPDFTEQLKTVVKNIRDALRLNETTDPDLESPIAHSPLFNELHDALKSQKITEIKRILNTLDQQIHEPQLKKILEQVSDQVLMTEFDNAAKILEDLITMKN